MMGGIPTNQDGQVLDGDHQVIGGLYAAGECACVSVHGANRLGCNSLLDLVVFGRRAGKRMVQDLQDLPWTQLHARPEEKIVKKIQTLKERKTGERAGLLRSQMQEAMTAYCSVYRQKDGLSKAITIIQSIMDRYEQVTIDNLGLRFNTELLEALELESLLGLAEAILVSALAREESRGAHSREDFPQRDDQNWLKHTLIQKADEGIRLFYKPVTITKFEPKPRVY
jgi:succinate dehydrogenase / fumarate reductase flavoprotein subunit